MTLEQIAGTPHHFLAQLVGQWTGKTRTWFERGVFADESPTQGSIHLLLEGRFAFYLYQSAMEGEPVHGMFTFGYNTTLDQYGASWVDSYHNNTAIMFCIGGPKGKGFFVLGEYPDPTGGPDWGWRTEVEMPDGDHLNITAYNIDPEKQEYKAVETTLTRIKK
jgi:hypothetical protein